MISESKPTTYVLAEVPADSPIKGYMPKGGAKELWQAHDLEVIIEGPAETGKTLAALQKIDASCWKYPEAQWVIMRKSQRSVYESVLQTYLYKVLQSSPEATNNPQGYVKPFGGTRPEMFTYPNGSTIWIAGMDSADKVLSSERDGIYVNQCEELSLAEWETLSTRVTGRAGHVTYPQLIGDCNPSSPLHWILSRLKKGSLKLIHSSHKDNPVLWDEKAQVWTMQGRRTMQVLEKLTGSRRSRLLQGLWMIPEGAIFSMFDETLNKVDSFIPPHTWPRVVGVDPKGAYIGALWGAWDQGNTHLHIFREYLQPFGLTTQKHCENILGLSRTETIWRWFGGGPSERQERLDYNGHGLPLEETLVPSVWVGIDKISELLNERVLIVHDCCVGLLSEIGTYKRTVDKMGTSTESIEYKDQFHLIDALRYLITGLTGPVDEVEVSQIIYNPVSIGRSF